MLGLKDGQERQLSKGENHRQNYAIAAISPHSHSIVPGGFDVTS